MYSSFTLSELLVKLPARHQSRTSPARGFVLDCADPLLEVLHPEVAVAAAAARATVGPAPGQPQRRAGEHPGRSLDLDPLLALSFGIAQFTLDVGFACCQRREGWGNFHSLESYCKSRCLRTFK